MEKYSYEQGEDGKFYILMFGRRSRGFRTSDTEQDAKERVAEMYVQDEYNDQEDLIYSRMYCY